MVNAIIIEDETSSMEYLMSILKRNHQNINVLGWATNVDDAVKLIESETPEIVFLDIQLLDGNGFDVLDHLKDNMTFEVIFTTGYLDYKERAMDYFAFYYLNKPVQESEMKKVLKMYELKRSAFDMQKYLAFKKQLKNKNQAITIFENEKYIPIKFSDILYCEASGSYTIINLPNKKCYMITKNLKRIESMILSDDFHRVHRSFLVNLKHIKTFSKDGIIVMADDSEILISARNRKKVVDFLKTYIK